MRHTAHHLAASGNVKLRPPQRVSGAAPPPHACGGTCMGMCYIPTASYTARAAMLRNYSPHALCSHDASFGSKREHDTMPPLRVSRHHQPPPPTPCLLHVPTQVYRKAPSWKHNMPPACLPPGRLTANLNNTQHHQLESIKKAIT
jgi:hypothetical protein